MAGNISEWIHDRWVAEVRPAGVDPFGPNQTEPCFPELSEEDDRFGRTVRGGSWGSGPNSTAFDSRASGPETLRDPTIGLRIVRTAP